MADLKTDYVNDVLDTDVNNERTYNLVDANGNLIYEGIKIRETTVLATTGDNYGATQINEQNTFINGLKADFSQALTDLKATAIAQAVGATGTTFASVISKLGEIVNRGAWSSNATSNGTITIPQGYHNGSGTVSVNVQHNPSFGMVATAGDRGGGGSAYISGYKRYIVFVSRSNNESGYPTVSGCGATYLSSAHMMYAQVCSVYYCTSSGTITISGDVVRGWFVVGVN